MRHKGRLTVDKWHFQCTINKHCYPLPCDCDNMTFEIICLWVIYVFIYWGLMVLLVVYWRLADSCKLSITLTLYRRYLNDFTPGSGILCCCLVQEVSHLPPSCPKEQWTMCGLILQNEVDKWAIRPEAPEMVPVLVSWFNSFSLLSILHSIFRKCSCYSLNNVCFIKKNLFVFWMWLQSYHLKIWVPKPSLCWASCNTMK